MTKWKRDGNDLVAIKDKKGFLSVSNEVFKILRAA